MIIIDWKMQFFIHYNGIFFKKYVNHNRTANGDSDYSLLDIRITQWIYGVITLWCQCGVSVVSKLIPRGDHHVVSVSTMIPQGSYHVVSV